MSYLNPRDHRANPHRAEYDPRYNPNPAPPTYQKFPQPIYYDRNENNYREPYVAPKFDFRTDPRFHREYPQQQQQAPLPRQSDQYRSYDDHDRPAGDHQDFFQQTHRDEDTGATRKGYDEVPRAGRANKYTTRITDLLTSITDPPHKDDHFHRTMEANKGYLVMMRFLPQDLSEVINAVQESVSSIAAHDGYAIGFSEPGMVKILLPSHQMMAKDQWYDPRPGHSARFAVACFWFKDAMAARVCFESTRRFKQPDFPNSSPPQIIAVPLTYGRNKDAAPFSPESDHLTLFWTEYPAIYERYKHDFLSNYSEPTRSLIKQYGGNPNIVVCRYKPGWDPDLNKFGTPGYARFEVHHQRVGRSIKNGWLLPDNFVTVSTFPSERALIDFYRDERYRTLLNTLPQYADPVMVAITLHRVRGTSRV
ncbi:uncharacterized protein LOC127845326 isoform X2 [Dreissena polymorpha]|uniref:uncharacterized protein LOC127845326 isoform X2 n=1 Tax=Dreissena polymorpha TaxID=45954 RepID=UPI0022652D0E|nr:uncharacterized protein LOC127845326 isoform X2 [Dreissena polymorpha]